MATLYSGIEASADIGENHGALRGSASRLWRDDFRPLRIERAVVAVTQS